MAETEQQSILALVATKEQLFANLSHEFRTPLTLVLGPAQVIKNKSNNHDITYHANLIERNAKRLLSMVDQLLQLAQIKEKQTEKETYQHVATVCGSTLQSFQVLAVERQITLSLTTEIDDTWWVKGAPNALEIILFNLLTNAFKHTKVQGHISISVNAKKKWMEFLVADTGCGIAKQQQEKIFERFTRLDNGTEYTPGAGIGLALVKELIVNVGGNIRVESEIKQGANFIFQLPKQSSSTSLARAKINQKVQGSNIWQVESFEKQHDTSSCQADTETNHTEPLSVSFTGGESTYLEKKILLIVDDNLEMRSFLKQILEEDYHIIEASNGKQGVAMAYQYSPDIILCDVMMPEMDGFELLSTVRANMAISHIPIILLTAKSDQQSKLKGLSEFADDYITKPFEPEQLKVRMQNLLGIRSLLQQRLGGAYQSTNFVDIENANSSEESQSLSSKDQLFVDRINELLKQEHADSELSLPMIAEKLAMSDRQFQRKIKALLGITFSELLRDHRLEQAGLLLNQGEQVAVTAYQVGFNSSSYFVRCFKAKYGHTPNEFRKAS